MFALNHVLVPTNRGEPSRAALRYGVAFAKKFDAQLHIVHVLPDHEYDVAIEKERVLEQLMPEERPVLPGGPEPDPDAVVHFAAMDDIGELLEPDDVVATRAEFLIRREPAGGPGDAIIECAVELGVEMIVMGKHRLGFVEHLLGGSVTEKVVRQAPCPVLIVHYPEQEFVVPD